MWLTSGSCTDFKHWVVRVGRVEVAFWVKNNPLIELLTAKRKLKINRELLIKKTLHWTLWTFPKGLLLFSNSCKNIYQAFDLAQVWYWRLNFTDIFCLGSLVECHLHPSGFHSTTSKSVYIYIYNLYWTGNIEINMSFTGEIWCVYWCFKVIQWVLKHMWGGCTKSEKLWCDVTPVECRLSLKLQV